MSPTDLFNDHIHLPHICAKTMFRTTPPQVSYDELHAAALEGLWKASETWNHERGAKFTTYAQTCMARCAIDWLRKAHRKKASKVPLPVSLHNIVNGHCKGLGRYYKPLEGCEVLPDTRRRYQGLIDDIDQIDCKLQRLKQPLASVIRGYFVDGYTVKELAKQHCKSISWIAIHLKPYCDRAGLKRNREIKARIVV